MTRLSRVGERRERPSPPPREEDAGGAADVDGDLTRAAMAASSALALGSPSAASAAATSSSASAAIVSFGSGASSPSSPPSTACARFDGDPTRSFIDLAPSVVSFFLSAASSARRRFRFAMRRRAAPSDPRSFLATPTLMPWTLNTATHPAAHHAHVFSACLNGTTSRRPMLRRASSHPRTKEVQKK